MKNKKLGNNNKKNNSIVAKISIILLVLSFFAIGLVTAVMVKCPANPICYYRGIFTYFSGSKNAEGNPSSYWQVEKLQKEDGSDISQKVQFLITKNSDRYLKEIWINVSDVYENSTYISVNYGSEATTQLCKYELTRNEVRKSKDGWIKIYSTSVSQTSSSYLTLVLNSKLHIRELIFVDDKNDTISVSFEKYIILNSEYNSSSDKVANEDNSVLKLIDEQKTFKHYKVS